MEKCECIFCGVNIEKNVTAFLAITNWEKQEEKQQSQQFFCHFECFKKALGRPELLYIEE